MKSNILSRIKYNVTHNWSAIRVFRLAMAIIMSAYAVYEAEYLWLIVGGWFLYQTLLNIGCCGVQQCAIPHPKQENNQTK